MQTRLIINFLSNSQEEKMETVGWNGFFGGEIEL